MAGAAGRPPPTLCRLPLERGQELVGRLQLLDDVQAAHQLTLHIHLGRVHANFSELVLSGGTDLSASRQTEFASKTKQDVGLSRQIEFALITEKMFGY